MSDIPSSSVSIELGDARRSTIAAFQRSAGLDSFEAAVLMLLDIALEATTGTGRRFWDRRLVTDDPVERARALVARLQAEGHAAGAERLDAASREGSVGERIGAEVADALSAAVEFALTTVEALDPKTRLMAEELRGELARWRLGR